MKRRKFFRTSLGGLVGIAALRGKRVFGQPYSLEPASTGSSSVYSDAEAHLLKLHLSIGAPPYTTDAHRYEYFEAHLRMAAVATDIVRDADAAQLFVSAPNVYLQQAGFPPGDVNLNSRPWRFVLSLADPNTRQAALSGNAVLYVNIMAVTQPWLESAGIFVNTVAIANVIAAVNLVAVAVAVVLVEVVGVDSVAAQYNEEAQLAATLGGKLFAKDVVKTLAIRRSEALIQAIENDQLALTDPNNIGMLPEGGDYRKVNKGELIQAIRESVARHFP